MVGAVKDGPGEVVEAGVDDVEEVVGLLLDGADFGDQIAALGGEVAARFDLEVDLVVEAVFESLAGGVPDLEVLVDVDGFVVVCVGRGESAAGADGGEAAAEFDGGLFHGFADLGEVLEVGAGADVHVEAGDGQAVVVGVDEAVVELLVPDAMLGGVAAGVGFLAVAVAEAGVDSEGDIATGGAAAVLVDHVWGAAIDVDVLVNDEVEGFGVEDVGRVDDGWG